MSEYLTKLNQYVEDVLSGTTVAGELLKLSVKRYIRDLDGGKYRLNNDKFNKCCSFISKLKHYVGLHRGKNFSPEGWQLFIIANIVGLYRADSDIRKYNYSYIQVARKNGKTFFAAALALYYLIADNEYSAEVVCAANTFPQSQLVYNVCQTLMYQLDAKYKYHSFHRGKDISYRPANSILHAIASKSRGLDGFNVSFGVIDEYHAAQDSSVRDVLASSMGMRLNPHLMIITTAGFDLESCCHQLRNDCVDMLKSTDNSDNNIFSAIFELDKDDDYADESIWQKANPNLGVTVRTEWLRDTVASSKMYRSEETNTLTKNFNRWVSGAQIWVDEQYLRFETFPKFDKSAVLAYVGVDLSSTSDLTAANFLIKQNDMFYFDTRYYLPEKFKSESQYINLKFREWAANGYLTLTQGNVTDYDYILRDILNYTYPIRGVYYDSYNATQFAINAQMQGVTMIPYSQSVSSFNKPTKEMERLIMLGNVIMNYNPLTLHCYRNVKLKIDYNNNCKPDKSNTANKIDGVIAQLMSLAGYLLDPSSPSIG
jgi:phage terminase large subunit-like protein